MMHSSNVHLHVCVFSFFSFLEVSAVYQVIPNREKLFPGRLLL